MAKAKNKSESALITEANAQNNPHLGKILNALQEGYKPNRVGKSMHQIRIDHTAAIPNPTDVWAWRKDPITGKNVEPRLLYRAGWYLSLEDKYVIDQLMEDDDNRRLNKEIQAHREANGLAIEKPSASQKEVKVVDGE